MIQKQRLTRYGVGRMRSVKRWMRRDVVLKSVVLSVALGVLTVAYAIPYRPTSDADVIETLPAGSATYQSRMLINAKGTLPFSVVAPQISALLTRSYSQGDPRALGQAESLLEPYQTLNTPEIMMYRATILQANHHFDESKALLQKILNKIPNQPDSVLMLSSINLVQGRFEDARKECEGIRDMGLMILRFACVAQVDDMTGKLVSSRDVLYQLTQINNGLDAGQLRWINLILADIAIRLNDPVLAKSVFEQLDMTTAPSLTARADWLLDHRYWAETQHLLASHKDNDALLIRLVISEVQLKSPTAQADLQLLGERMKVWDERGETAHQREQAMYAMMLNPPAIALNLARNNWQKQRETADVAIYTNAAIRAHSVSDMKIIQDWIKQTGFEYPRLTDVLAQSIKAG
jgi:tetratricopeptide (TPR) repeat protein